MIYLCISNYVYIYLCMSTYVYRCMILLCFSGSLREINEGRFGFLVHRDQRGITSGLKACHDTVQLPLRADLQMALDPLFSVLL